MLFNIKDKDVELKFDIGFIRRLDSIHKGSIESVNIQFGAGLLMANMMLQQRNPVILSDIILCATKGFKQIHIDEAIEKYAEENDGLEKLFKEIQEELGKSSVVKGTMKVLENRAK